MKLYLDNCCYCRPFDDQSQERIFLQQFESGVGDYTREKYEKPDVPVKELISQLKVL